MRAGLDLNWVRDLFADVNWVGTWGAVVATGLAILRIIEFFRDRSPRFEVTCMWRGDAEAGNDVLLINHGRVPVSIYHFGLVWGRPRWFRQPVEVYSEFDLQDDFSTVVVQPFSTHAMHFSEADHFNDKPPKSHPTARLYLKAWVVGRKKPVWRPVFE